MKLGTLDFGPGVACIAELGNAHNGSLDRAIRLLDAAKACGASAAKLQAYTPDELVALRGDGPAPSQWGEQGWTMRDLYTKAQTPLPWFATLYGHAASIGLPIFSSVFGPESLAVLEDVGNPVYKLAALERKSRDLYRIVKATRKPRILSTHAEWDASTNRQERMLWCPVGYPQSGIRFSHDVFKGEWTDDYDEGAWQANGMDGFSYHGTDYRVPVVAATLGASILEVHFMLDDEPNELESNVSLGEAAFARMVDDVRAMESVMYR